jgi:hypothetical protein
MNEQGHCTPGDCPGATENGETVSIYSPFAIEELPKLNFRKVL